MTPEELRATMVYLRERIVDAWLSRTPGNRWSSHRV